MQRLKTFLTGEKATSAQLCRSWLVLGGTGMISEGVVEHLRHASQVTCLNRGSRALPQGVGQIICDVNDEAAMVSALQDRYFDVVVDFLTFTPDQARARVRQLLGRCGRYVFISTAATYEKPAHTLLITEKTAQINPYSSMAQNKILCEAVLRGAMRQQGFPLTILRPGTTYGDRDIPFILRPQHAPYTLVRRMLEGRPVLVPGDGNVFRSITHATDMARAIEALANHPDALGEDFHIAQDECVTWNDVARLIAQEAGAPQPTLVHVATDQLVREKPELRASLMGDLSHHAAYDNTKLRQFVPGFRFHTALKDGVKKSLLHFAAHPQLQTCDEGWNAWADDVIRRAEGL